MSSIDFLKKARKNYFGLGVFYTLVGHLNFFEVYDSAHERKLVLSNGGAMQRRKIVGGNLLITKCLYQQHRKINVELWKIEKYK